ncbi:MAG: dethiobiotin synthase [Polyangiaceae bacterium]|nr:dethiobiotin synthase [Polyangiaceae bacterium]
MNLPSKPQVLLVLGTGTEIGKTYFSSALLRRFQDSGTKALGLKPVESGVPQGEVGSDAQALASASRTPATQLFSFIDPVSPHLAAGREGATIDFIQINQWVEERIQSHQPELTLLETAGGAFSPLSSSSVNASLYASLSTQFSVEVLLLAPNRLGVLSDLTAYLRALAAFSVNVDYLVLNTWQNSERESESKNEEFSRVEDDFSLDSNFEELNQLILPQLRDLHRFKCVVDSSREQQLNELMGRLQSLSSTDEL